MIDLIVIGEGAWFWFWIRNKTGERALLYVAAIFTALFVSTKVTGWFMRRFMTSGNTFMWLVEQMKASTHPVGVVSKVIPPAPMIVGVSEQSKWVALHVLQGMLSVLITAAIFALFVVVEYLMDAFWDDYSSPISTGDKVISNVSATICGLAMIIITLWFLANLSWVPFLHGLADSANHSVLFVLLGNAAEFLRYSVAML